MSWRLFLVVIFIVNLSSVHKAAESESEDHYSGGSSLREQLSSWVTMFNVKHNADGSLLKLLVKHEHSDLLTTTRRLMGNTQAI